MSSITSLNILQDSILLLSTVQELCTQTFNSWNQRAKFQDVEVALSLLYQLAEALPASHGQHFSGDPTKATAVQNTMRLVSDLGFLYTNTA